MSEGVKDMSQPQEESQQPQQPRQQQQQQPPEILATDGPSPAREKWKAKLTAFFAVRAPQKTEKDVDLCLQHFETKGGGYENMMAQAVKRYGPEPTDHEVRAAVEKITWADKLRALYVLVDPSKTEKDVEDCLAHFGSKAGGYERMWQQVQKKYGISVSPMQELYPQRSPQRGMSPTVQRQGTTSPTRRPNSPPQRSSSMWLSDIQGLEMTPEEQRRIWGERLASYFKRVDSTKTDADVRACLDHFGQRPGGYERMWQQLQNSYGVFISPKRLNSQPSPRRGTPKRQLERNDAEFETAVCEALKMRQSARSASPSTAADSRFAVVVVLSGVSMKLYREASHANQFNFNNAVASEIQVLVNLPSPLSVTKVSESGEGCAFEMHGRVPPSVLGSQLIISLVRQVMSGQCTVASIRQGYYEYIRGNPQRVFLVDAAAAEYRATPGIQTAINIPGTDVPTRRSLEPVRSGSGTWLGFEPDPWDSTLPRDPQNLVAAAVPSYVTEQQETSYFSPNTYSHYGSQQLQDYPTVGAAEAYSRRMASFSFRRPDI